MALALAHKGANFSFLPLPLWPLSLCNVHILFCSVQSSLTRKQTRYFSVGTAEKKSFICIRGSLYAPVHVCERARLYVSTDACAGECGGQNNLMLMAEKRDSDGKGDLK